MTQQGEYVKEIELLKCDGQDTCGDWYETKRGHAVGDKCPTEMCNGVLREATADEIAGLRDVD